jgi:serine protease Do
VNIQDVDQALANSFGLTKPQGALVSRVEPGSPAAEAGLKSGDVILAVNGDAITQLSELPAKIAATRPGSNVELQVWRDRKEQNVQVTVGKLEEEKLAAATTEQGAANAGKLGLAVRELTQQERSQLQAEGGLLVESAQGAAARAGIQPGDVILAVGDTPVKSVDQLRALTEKSGKTVALLVQRNEVRTYIPIPVG